MSVVIPQFSIISIFYIYAKMFDSLRDFINLFNSTVFFPLSLYLFIYLFIYFDTEYFFMSISHYLSTGYFQKTLWKPNLLHHSICYIAGSLLILSSTPVLLRIDVMFIRTRS